MGRSTPPTKGAVGAFVPDTHVTRAGAPRGPLAGKTFAVKDLFDIAEHTASCGNPDWRASHGPARRDAPVIAQLLQAGASLVGVTVMDELAYSLAGRNVHQGTPENPRAPGRVCGGSSSGSASATAGFLCDFALGTDTAGSIRVPAAYCGLFGLRPSHGRIPLAGAAPLAPSFDTLGWLARDASTLAAVGEVLLDAPLADLDKPLRVLMARDAWSLLDTLTRGALEDAAEAFLAQLDADVHTIDLAPGGLDRWRETFRRIQAREVWGCHGRWLEATAPRLGPDVRARFADAKQVAEGSDGPGARDDEAAREAIRRHLAALLPRGTLLCLPSAPSVAPRVDAAREDVERGRAQTLTLTCVAPLGGLPQISLPLAELEGCPLGLGFAAGAGEDGQLLSLATHAAHRT